MNILACIVVGLIAGWIAERVTGRNHGLLTNLIVGIVGALVGDFLFSTLLGFSYVEGFNLPTVAAATAGSIILLAMFGGFRSHPNLTAATVFGRRPTSTNGRSDDHAVTGSSCHKLAFIAVHHQCCQQAPSAQFRVSAKKALRPLTKLPRCGVRRRWGVRGRRADRTHVSFRAGLDRVGPGRTDSPTTLAQSHD